MPRRFYLKFIEPAKTVIDRDEYEFAGLDALENVDSVMGLAFENLVVNNYHELVPYLHLKGIVITSAAPYLRKGSFSNAFALDRGLEGLICGSRFDILRT